MPTSAQHGHTLATRCDACNQQATHRATRAGAATVQLCDHHATVNKAGLTQAGFIVTALTTVHA